MLGLKVGLAGWALGAVAAISMTFMWQREKLHHADTKAQLAAATAKAEAMEARANAAEKNFNRNSDLLASQMEALNAVNAQLAEIEKARAVALAELDRLKAGETRRALEIPFERGNAAAERRDRIMCRIFTESDNCASTDTDANNRGTDSGGAQAELGVEESAGAGDNAGGRAVLPGGL